MFRLRRRGDTEAFRVLPLGRCVSGWLLTPRSVDRAGTAAAPGGVAGPGERRQVPSDGRPPERAPTTAEAFQHILEAEGAGACGARCCS